MMYAMSDLLADPPPEIDDPSAALSAGLNDAQRSAVAATDGAVLVLAGAGTGKTRALTTRLAHILASGRAYPGEILAVTFTNKAAREMKERLEALVGRAADGVWLGTFHALAARILRRHAELVGLQSNFTILDSDDQLRLLKQIIAAANIDERRWPARALHGAIERWKDRGLVPDKVPEAEAGDWANGRAVALYRDYQQRLATVNAVDFGDLLLHNLTLFTGNVEILAHLPAALPLSARRRIPGHQRRAISVAAAAGAAAQEYVLRRRRRPVDLWLARRRDRQHPEIRDDFPGALVVRLEENYRSTPQILAAAAGLIAHNRGRLGKTLWTAGRRGRKGRRARVCGTPSDEARWVGDEIEALQRRKAQAARDRDPGARRFPDARVRGAFYRARRCPTA